MQFNGQASLADHFKLVIKLIQCENMEDGDFEAVTLKVGSGVGLLPLSLLTEDADKPLNDFRNFLQKFYKINQPYILLEYSSDRNKVQPTNEVEHDALSLHYHKRFVPLVRFVGTTRSENILLEEKYSEEWESSLNVSTMHIVHTIYIDYVNKENDFTRLKSTRYYLGQNHLIQSLPKMLNMVIRNTVRWLVINGIQNGLNAIDTQQEKIKVPVTSEIKPDFKARIRKQIADCYLCIGEPLYALQWYAAARDFARKNNDIQCLGGCYEGEAAAVYLYQMTTGRTQFPEYHLPRIIRRTDDLEKPPWIAMESLPIEIERILTEMCKRWPLSLPGGTRSRTTLLEDVLQDMVMSNSKILNLRHLQDKSLFLRCVRDDVNLFMVALILLRLRDALTTYEKVHPDFIILEMEALLKKVHFLSNTFNCFILATGDLNRIVDLSLKLDWRCRRTALIGSAHLALSWGAKRKSTFLNLLAMKIYLRNDTMLNSAYSLPFSYPSPCLSGAFPADIDMDILSDNQGDTPLSEVELHRFLKQSLLQKEHCTSYQHSLRIFTHCFSTSSLRFLSSHIQRITGFPMTNPHIMWPKMRLYEQKMLLTLYLKRNEWKLAAITVYTILCMYNAIFNTSSELSLLNMLSMLRQKTKQSIRLPATLIVLDNVEEQHNTSTVAGRTVLKDADSSSSGFFLFERGTHGCSYSIPLLCSITISMNKKGMWLQPLGQDHWNCVCKGQSQHAKDASSIPRRSLQHSSPILTPSISLTSFVQQNQGSTGTASKNNINVKPVHITWSSVEPISVSLVLYSSLHVPLRVESIHLLSLGGSLQTLCDPFVLSPQTTQCVPVIAIPMSAAPIWIIGASFRFLGVDVSQLRLSSQTHDCASTFEHMNDLDTLLNVLRSECFVSADVVDSVPQYSHRFHLRPQHPRPNYEALGSSHADTSNPASSATHTSPVASLFRHDNFSKLKPNVFNLFPHEYIHSANLSAVFEISNNSNIQPIHTIHITVLNSFSLNASDFLNGIVTSGQHPDTFFVKGICSDPPSNDAKGSFVLIDSCCAMVSNMKMHDVYEPHFLPLQRDKDDTFWIFQDLPPRHSLYIYLRLQRENEFYHNAALM